MKFRFLVCVIAVLLSVGVAFSQEDNTSLLQGVVDEISEDATYIIVDGTKIMTAPGLIEDIFLEEGDEVIVETIVDGDMLTAVTIEYYVEEEDMPVEEVETDME